ncbi:MAG: putative glycosyl hydrolase [Phycisphaerales bacterium]|jgi:hypothetical protein|nr:putative glycosyl hydrolase [Phycisphaerales bacterium]
MHAIRIGAVMVVFGALFAAARADEPKPKDGPATAPAVVQADGSLLLTPLGARIHGSKLRVEQKPTPVIVNWIDPNENVEWPKAVAKKGKYEVEITYSCPPNAGGEFVVAAAAAKITGRTENTGNWQTFRTVKVGTFTVLNDQTPVALRSTGNFNHLLMNVRSVKLTPVPEEKPKK